MQSQRLRRLYPEGCGERSLSHSTEGLKEGTEQLKEGTELGSNPLESANGPQGHA